MKTKLLLVVVVISCLSGLGHAQSLSHYNWRPIDEIGAAEIQVIEMIIRRSAMEILSSAKSFTRSNNTLIIADKVGVWHFFASGSVVDSVGSSGGPEKKEDNLVRISEADDKKHEDSLSKLEKLYSEFVDLWFNEKADKKEIDSAAETFFIALNEVLATDQSFLKNTLVLDHLKRTAAKGNRYFGLIVPLLEGISAYEVVSIYQNYINADMATVFDKPSPAEMIDVLYVIGKLAMSNPNIKIEFTLLRSMEILAPDLYRKLTK